MIASLPMYDRPETAAANDRLWDLIRENFAGPLPEELDRCADPWTQWQSPALILSQTCGMPFRTKLVGSVDLVGTPVHPLDCQPGHYFSVLVTQAYDDRNWPNEFDGATLAYNNELSQSGFAAPLAAARTAGLAFGGFVHTGAHAASALAVAEGRAEIAALDAVSWTMIRRWDLWAQDLREAGRTDPTPALPYITAKDGPAEALFTALDAAIDALSRADKDLLCVDGLTHVSNQAYLSVETPALSPN